MVSPVVMLNAPCSIDSSASRFMARTSSGVAALSSVAPTAMRRALCPSCAATLMPTPFSSTLLAHSSIVVQSHSVSEAIVKPMISCRSPGAAFPEGKGE